MRRVAMFVYTMFSGWRAAPRRKVNVSILIYFYDIPCFFGDGAFEWWGSLLFSVVAEWV
jgi:hypothetical protein